MLSINSNHSAMSSSIAAKKASTGIDNAIEKLSSGSRINFAKDDAAGQAIATRLSAEIMGLEQASRNASYVVKGVAIADSALQEVASLILRSRELSVAAANGTYSDLDREALNAELSQLVEEIVTIGNNTKFAGIKFFEDKIVSFQIGPNSGNVFTVDAQHFSTVGLSQAGFFQGNILNETSAQLNIAAMDSALSVVSSFRSSLASTSNRMEHLISNLDSVKSNLSIAQGRIQDADFAKETGNLANSQILQQAATAMIAQANINKASVLYLLET